MLLLQKEDYQIADHLIVCELVLRNRARYAFQVLHDNGCDFCYVYVWFGITFVVPIGSIYIRESVYLRKTNACLLVQDASCLWRYS